jgi:hypothetical protein
MTACHYLPRSVAASGSPTSAAIAAGDDRDLAAEIEAVEDVHAVTSGWVSMTITFTARGS